MASWPESSSKIVDLIESTCFAFIKSDLPMLKTGIKAGKTGQEILEEYQPWKKTIEEIDMALVSENTIRKGDAAAEKSPVKEQGQQPSETPEPKLLTAFQEGPDLTTIEDDWLAVVGRIIAKHVNLAPWFLFTAAMVLGS